MIFSRENHHTVETEALPGPDRVPATALADDEKTPPIWWVKTIASWTLLAAAVALLAALVVIPRLTGSTAYTVLTGSMQPTYPPGTLIVVKPIAGADLEAGDVITFQPKSGDPSVTTHRIVSIVYDAKGERKFITKGDANNTTDPGQLVEGQIRGKLFYSVPYLGHLNSVLSGSSRSIMMIVVVGALGAYALWMWISGFRDRKKPKDSDDPESGAKPADITPQIVGYAPPVPQETMHQHDDQRCYACGADQSGRRPLAYSALDSAADAVAHGPRHAVDVPSTEITRPIPTIK